MWSVVSGTTTPYLSTSTKRCKLKIDLRKIMLSKLSITIVAIYVRFQTLLAFSCTMLLLSMQYYKHFMSTHSSDYLIITMQIL